MLNGPRNIGKATTGSKGKEVRRAEPDLLVCITLPNWKRWAWRH
jgi:hypothetical protein